MPAKKRPSGPDVPDDSTAWRIILEDIKTQNRTTLEAVQTSHNRLTDQFHDLRERYDARFDLVMTALRDIRIRVEGVETRVERVETRVERVETKAERIETNVARVEAKVDKLVPLEERVTALERRRA